MTNPTVSLLMTGAMTGRSRKRIERRYKKTHTYYHRSTVDPVGRIWYSREINKGP